MNYFCESVIALSCATALILRLLAALFLVHQLPADGPYCVGCYFCCHLENSCGLSAGVRLSYTAMDEALTPESVSIAPAPVVVPKRQHPLPWLVRAETTCVNNTASASASSHQISVHTICASVVTFLQAPGPAPLLNAPMSKSPVVQPAVMAPHKRRHTLPWLVHANATDAAYRTQATGAAPLALGGAATCHPPGDNGVSPACGGTAASSDAPADNSTVNPPGNDAVSLACGSAAS